VVFVPGVVPGFNLVCQALAGAGDSIIMFTPVYPPFLSAPANAGAEKIEVPMLQSAQGRYEIDFEAFEAAIQTNTKVFMLCNPHNPVGRVFSREELQQLGDICLRHGVTICSDEIHSDLVFSGHTHTPIASISEDFDQNSVTLIAPSKTFNIAGLECSAILCKNPELRKKLETARKGLLGGVNVLGLTAGMAAYQQGDEWLKELLAVLETNRDLLTNFIQARIPEIKIFPAEATYLAWLDCRELNLPGGAYNFFLKEGRVALNEGKDFGAPGEGFLRFNFGCPTVMVQEALERMEEAVRGTNR
jgi:cystathionine beta-lyase